MIFKINETAFLERGDHFLGRLLPPSRTYFILELGEVDDWDSEGIRIGCSSNQSPFSDDASYVPESMIKSWHEK